jgi:hypothetical protein
MRILGPSVTQLSDYEDRRHLVLSRCTPPLLRRLLAALAGPIGSLLAILLIFLILLLGQHLAEFIVARSLDGFHIGPALLRVALPIGSCRFVLSGMDKVDFIHFLVLLLAQAEVLFLAVCHPLGTFFCAHFCHSGRGTATRTRLGVSSRSQGQGQAQKEEGKELLQLCHDAIGFDSPFWTLKAAWSLSVLVLKLC